MAEAITIHKSQGSSYERVTIELPKRNERSLIYVALSRATSLQGLFLLGKFKPTNPDPGQNQDPQQQQNTGQVRNLRNRHIVQRQKIYPFEEMNRLRNEAMLIPKFTKLTDVPNDCFQIVSHNVRSLNAHAKCLSSDTVVLASHIALFQETWLKTNDNHNIPNKVVVARNMLPDLMTRGKGTIIYGSDQINIESLGHFDRNKYTHADLTVCKFQNIIIVNIYKSDNATIHNLDHNLKKIEQYMLEPNVLVCGDFNDELSALNNSTTKLFNDKFNFKLLSPLLPTTDRGTSIDGVFGRLRDYDFDITLYESYFSDHKPLVIRIFKKKQDSHTGLTQDLQTINV